MLDFIIPSALAAGEATGASSAAGFEGLIFPVALIAIFYFLLIRPQQKRAKEHKKLIDNAAKGDEVVTGGGVLGKITEVGESFVTLEVGNNISVQVMKTSITSIMPKGTYKAAIKSDAKIKK